MELAWPPHDRNRHDKRWSLCASLLLHALLLLVLSSHKEFAPLVGRETRLDIFWLAMSPASPVAPAAASPAPRAAKRPEAPRSAVRALARPRNQEPEQAPVRIITAAASKPWQAPQPAPLPTRPASEKAAEPAKVERASLKAAQPNPQPLVQEAAGSNTSEPATPALPAPEPQAPSPREALHTPAPKKGQEQRGLVIASPRGGLKMLITGAELKLSVQFRGYPRSSRNSPPRSEARRQQEIVPVWVTAGDQAREAVIEKASEGVYLFSVEPVGDSSAQGSFTLKIFEAGRGEKVTPLGSRTITGKTVLARILMPEAVLWDDDHAFTGSLQDSDSTTKFNSETGLYWKEYDN